LRGASQFGDLVEIVVVVAKNELHLRGASQFGDLVEIVVVVAKYTSSSDISTRIPHLESEEMFGLAKRKVDHSSWLEVDSHWHDWVNFFHLKVANAMAPINQSSVVNVGEGNNVDPIVTHNGADVLECFYGNDIWRIECCPLKSNQLLFNVAKRH
jgi:hypothetical protein